MSEMFGGDSFTGLSDGTSLVEKATLYPVHISVKSATIAIDVDGHITGDIAKFQQTVEAYSTTTKRKEAVDLAMIIGNARQATRIKILEDANLTLQTSNENLLIQVNQLQSDYDQLLVKTTQFTDLLAKYDVRIKKVEEIL